jgi:hypothetical protein
MGYPANVVPLRCIGDGGEGPDAQGGGEADEIASVRIDTGPRGTRQRLFVPSTAWPELAAVVAAGVSGRSVGLWLAIRMQAKPERRERVRVRLSRTFGAGETVRGP